MYTSRIFAPGAYRWGNKGDAALVSAFLDWLREDFGTVTVELTSFVPKEDARHYGVPVHPMIIRPLHPLNRLAQKVCKLFPALAPILTRVRMRHLDKVVRALPRWVKQSRSTNLTRLIVPRRVRSMIRIIEQADAVFSVPGGYLLAPKPSDDWWLAHIPTFELVALLGRPLVLGPCSIGPFHPVHREYAAKLLAIPDVILLREDRSRIIVESLTDRVDRIVMSPDLAFMHKALPFTARGRIASAMLDRDVNSGPVIGVSVRSHHFPGFSDPENMFDVYLASVAEALTTVQRESGAKIWVFSQTEEDAPVSNALFEQLTSSGVSVFNADPRLDPSDLQTLYSSLDLLVGTRMHANILALTQGTPVVGIAYEPKTLGILESLGLGDWGIWIHEVSDGRLRDLVLRQWASRVESRAVAASAVSKKREELRLTAYATLQRLENL